MTRRTATLSDARIIATMPAFSGNYIEVVVLVPGRSATIHTGLHGETPRVIKVTDVGDRHGEGSAALGSSLLNLVRGELPRLAIEAREAAACQGFRKAAEERVDGAFERADKIERRALSLAAA